MATATYEVKYDARFLDVDVPPERVIFSTGEKSAMVVIPLFTLLLAALAIAGAHGAFQHVLSPDATPSIVKAFAISSGLLTGAQLLLLPGTLRHYLREKKLERLGQKAFINQF